MDKTISDPETEGSGLPGLYRLGGSSAMAAAACAGIQIVIEIIGVAIQHIEVPNTVLGWFKLLDSHTLFALTALTMFQIPVFIFCVPVFLALYRILKKVNPAVSIVAVTFALLGEGIYLAANTVFAMLSLSRQYAAATTEPQRAALLAAGQAMLALYEGVGVDVGLVIFLAAVLALSTLMLRSHIFSRSTAWVGILAGVLSLAYYASSPIFPEAIFILEAAGFLLVIWVLLVGRRLMRSGLPW